MFRLKNYIQSKQISRNPALRTLVLTERNKKCSLFSLIFTYIFFIRPIESIIDYTSSGAPFNFTLWLCAINPPFPIHFRAIRLPFALQHTYFDPSTFSMHLFFVKFNSLMVILRVYFFHQIHPQHNRYSSGGCDLRSSSSSFWVGDALPRNHRKLAVLPTSSALESNNSRTSHVRRYFNIRTLSRYQHQQQQQHRTMMQRVQTRHG